MSEQPNFQRISGHLQLQRNQFADAHAVAAARGDELADELERLRGQNATSNQRVDEKDSQIRALQVSLRTADETIGRQRNQISELLSVEEMLTNIRTASEIEQDRLRRKAAAKKGK